MPRQRPALAADVMTTDALWRRLLEDQHVVHQYFLNQVSRAVAAAAASEALAITWELRQRGEQMRL